jgi:anti-sigma B factor antagonist
MTTLSVSVRERRDATDAQGPGESLTVAVIGELDIATAPRFTARMNDLARHGSLRELVLDLSGLAFIDAGGLRALTELRSRIERRGAVLVLDGMPPQMRRLMRIIGPQRQFLIRLARTRPSPRPWGQRRPPGQAGTIRAATMGTWHGLSLMVPSTRATWAGYPPATAGG